MELIFEKYVFKITNQRVNILRTRHRYTALRNGPEQLTASHIPWAHKPLRQNSDLHEYDRLFANAHPDVGGNDCLQSLDTNSLNLVTACVEQSLAAAQPDENFELERHGYFVTAREDKKEGSKPVLNRMTGLKK